jgi:hypothetical protein
MRATLFIAKSQVFDIHLCNYGGGFTGATGFLVKKIVAPIQSLALRGRAI